MATWHRLGLRDELLARVPFSIKLERHQIAVFVHEGRFTAISNICNHKGGPLCEGRVRGEFVMCPWHGWEYSRSEEHTSELQSRGQLVCRLLLEKNKEYICSDNPARRSSDALPPAATQRRPKFRPCIRVRKFFLPPTPVNRSAAIRPTPRSNRPR